jgi:flagellar hook-associated protein 3 FlgL
MAINPVTLGRVSNLMRGNLASSTIARTQANLMEVQQQLTTGKRLAALSDDAGDAAIAQSVRKLLEKRSAYQSNLDAANSQLGEVDSGLGDVSDLLREAQQIASANVGSDVTSEARSAAASVVDSIYNQLLSTANKSASGSYLFAGDRSTLPPFEEANGGVFWTGSSDVLSNVYDEGRETNFQIDGAEVFGALSSRVEGHEDLTPAVIGTTRLDDLNGTQGKGIRRGTIAVSNGALLANIDLSDADTLNDVVSRINAAALGGVTASINAAGTGIDLAAGAADEITIKDVGGGTAALDLGIVQNTSAGAGVGVSGGVLGPRVTNLTPIASLKGGAGIDLSGLTITNGVTVKNISFAGAETVEDVLNAINNSGAAVKARINASGTGIDILNAVQGTKLVIAENGGSSGDDLGVRSFDGATKLSDLNDGKGITNVAGNELRITDSAGVSFEVDIDGLNTVGDLISRINTAATAAGAGVNTGYATVTNGLQLVDVAGGAGTLSISNLNNSQIINELGLDVPVSGGAIQGTDVGAVQSKGIFANIIRLRDSLRSDDQAEITRASEMLDEDLSRVIRIRGVVGAKVQEFEARSNSLADQNVATTALLSELEDTDFTSAIIKFQTLQNSLQASMQATGQTLNLSLMDFLR